MDAINIKNVIKSYENFLLNNVSFSVPEGEIVAIAGENGAGKTTLINLLLQLSHPDSGEIKFWDKDFNDVKEDIGIIYDSLYFNETLKPVELEKIFAASYKNWNKNLFFDLLESFGIDKTKKVKALSKGMKIKLQLALALAHKPKLLIIDEATSGLDPIFIDSFLDLLLDFIQDENHSIFISTHDLNHLEKIADRFVFIDNGKLLLDKNVEELRDLYGCCQVSREDFNRLDSEFITRFIHNDFSTEILIQNKKAFEEKYQISTEPVRMEEILRLFVKGEKIERSIN